MVGRTSPRWAGLFNHLFDWYSKHMREKELSPLSILPIGGGRKSLVLLFPTTLLSTKSCHKSHYTDVRQSLLGLLGQGGGPLP